jgi:hypothetical protein
VQSPALSRRARSALARAASRPAVRAASGGPFPSTGPSPVQAKDRRRIALPASPKGLLLRERDRAARRARRRPAGTCPMYWGKPCPPVGGSPRKRRSERSVGTLLLYVIRNLPKRSRTAIHGCDFPSFTASSSCVHFELSNSLASA